MVPQEDIWLGKLELLLWRMWGQEAVQPLEILGLVNHTAREFICRVGVGFPGGCEPNTFFKLHNH